MIFHFRIILIIAIMLSSLGFALDTANLAPPDALFFISLSDPAFIQKVRETGLIDRLYDAQTGFGGNASPCDHLKNWAADLQVSYDEWARIFPGAQCCYLTDLEFSSSGEPVFNITFIMEHNGNREQASAIIEKLTSQISPDAKKGSFVHNGAQVFTVDHTIRKSGKIESSRRLERKSPEASSSSGKVVKSEVLRELSFHFQYAFSDGFLFFCEGNGEPIKDLIDRFKSPGFSSLSQVKTYRLLFENASHENSARIYFNLEEILSRFAAFQKKEGKDISSLSLMDFKGLGIYQYSVSDSLMSCIRLYAPSERTGICDALFQFSPNPFSSLKFVPHDTIAYSSVSLDLYRIYHVLLGAASSLYPQEVATLRQTIQANNALLGVDLENQILGEIKGEMGYYIRSSTESSGRNKTAEAYFIEVANPDLFKQRLKKLFLFAKNSLAMEMKGKMLLDVEYWSPAPMGQSVGSDDFIPPFGIFMYDKYLFVSTDIAEIQDLITRLKSGEVDVAFSGGVKEFMERRPKTDCVGVRIIHQPASPSLYKGFHTLAGNIDPGNPVRALLEHGSQVAHAQSLMTMIYQNQDMLSIIMEIPFSGKLRKNSR
ncbi:hypothetical protein JW926_03970 [Candidatus Sumerlaeota bacterium]|nr:hypothetical protein [Candidatus Sumerlaeota bacterium]